METHIIQGDEEMYVKIQTDDHNTFVLEEAEGNICYQSDKFKMTLGKYRLLSEETEPTGEDTVELEEQLVRFFKIKDDFELFYSVAPQGSDDTVLELRHILVNEVHYITPYKLYITNNRGQTYQAV